MASLTFSLAEPKISLDQRHQQNLLAPRTRSVCRGHCAEMLSPRSNEPTSSSSNHPRRLVAHVASLWPHVAYVIGVVQANGINYAASSVCTPWNASSCGKSRNERGSLCLGKGGGAAKRDATGWRCASDGFWADQMLNYVREGDSCIIFYCLTIFNTRPLSFTHTSSTDSHHT